jgi:hypothetical protein
MKNSIEQQLSTLLMKEFSGKLNTINNRRKVKKLVVKFLEDKTPCEYQVKVMGR